MAGGSGAVDSSVQAVLIGGTATITFIHDPGYCAGSVTDNGAPVTPTPDGSYAVTNVTEHHEVVVTFMPASYD